MQADKLNEQLRRSERYNRNKANAQDRIHEDQDLLVVQDLDNGFEYFFYQIDAFRMDAHDYVCLASYEPDLGNHHEPELVIMRTSMDENGTRLYKSIRDEDELNAVFDAFYFRMESSVQ